MFTRYVLPFLAVAGLGFAVFSVVQARQAPPPGRPLIAPPEVPTFRSIAGAGLIEPRMENIPVGTPVAGVVWDVYVKIGQRVKKDAPLFRLDDRAIKAQIRVQEAMLSSAVAQLHRLENAPRPEDLPPAMAAVAEAEARLANAEISVSRSARLYERNAGPASDYDRDRFAAAEARATLARVTADLERLKKGTWKEDLLVARAAVEQAKSQLEATQIELDRLTVRALADGEVLQVNVRPGQFAALAWKEPLIVLGDVERLHVRVDIDEQDLPMFQRGAKAVATLKGRPGVRFDLDYVKVEPYVIPKRSLTGDNAERVDTRVLQVIYALPDSRPVPLYVGQQMDVYLEAAKTHGLKLDVDPKAKRPFEEDLPSKTAPRPKAA